MVFGGGGSCMVFRSLSCPLDIHIEMAYGHLGIGV